jgi:GntR family transcriptional regulator, transcriptional repressor for pyruvate dehydrogenase complex
VTSYSPRLIDTRTRADQVRDQVADLIRAQGLRPGQRLPTERQMMEMFGVGRTSVRAAVQSLIGLGVVEMRPGLGAFIKSFTVNDVTRMIAGAMDVHPSAVMQLWEARQMIEITSARLAAQRRAVEHLRAMSECLERAAEASERRAPEAFTDADVDFHAAFVRASQNEVFVTMLNAIAGLLRQTRPRVDMTPEVTAPMIREHREILAAIEAGDETLAVQLVEQHLHDFAACMQEGAALWTGPGQSGEH